MAEQIKNLWAGMPWYLYAILIFCLIMVVASFLVPPVGVVNSSVLQAIAIILGGTWLLYTTANIPTFIAAGAKVKASYGNASLEIGKKEGEV